MIIKKFKLKISELLKELILIIFQKKQKINFFSEGYSVSNLSDRMGMRLEGPTLENIVNTNIKSEGSAKE